MKQPIRFALNVAFLKIGVVVSGEMKDIDSCPYCQSGAWGCSANWGMSDEGWEELKRIHLEQHCGKCPTCGSPISIMAEGYLTMANEYAELVYRMQPE